MTQWVTHGLKDTLAAQHGSIAASVLRLDEDVGQVLPCWKEEVLLAGTLRQAGLGRLGNSPGV